jgi:hypothetical protein
MGRVGLLAPGAALGALAAGLYLAILSGSPGALILAYLAQLPLLAAGLWCGAGAVAVAGTVASVLALAIGGAAVAASFAGLYAAPAVLLVRQALLARRCDDGAVEWYPPGLLAAWLTGLGLLVMAAMIVILGGPHAIEARLNATLAPVVDSLADPAAAEGAELTKLLALVMPGAVAASWMAMTASNAVLAQGVLVRFGKAWRPSPDPAALTLPRWLSGLLAAAALLMLFGGTARFVGLNALIVVSVAFCLAGLAVVHMAARRLPRPQLALVLFYLSAGLFGWPLVVTAVLGVLDAPLGLRRRFAPTGSIGEKTDD